MIILQVCHQVIGNHKKTKKMRNIKILSKCLNSKFTKVIRN